MMMEAMDMKMLKASRPRFSCWRICWDLERVWGDGEARCFFRKRERAREVARPITTPGRLSNFIQSNK